MDRLQIRNKILRFSRLYPNKKLGELQFFIQREERLPRKVKALEGSIENERNNLKEGQAAIKRLRSHQSQFQESEVQFQKLVWESIELINGQLEIGGGLDRQKILKLANDLNSKLLRVRVGNPEQI